MRFEIGDEDFLLDGSPHRVLSGAIHYFRVHPDLWADRIQKARAMGLNTIETYVAWNHHEATPGVFDFASPERDLGRFIDLIHAAGMHAIVRPGPYICAEWWNGGLPPWLFADGTVGIRRNEPGFLDAIRRYLDALAPVIVPRQIDQGGPIVLVQIENEYGAYGDDPDYLRALVAMHRSIGLTVPFTTVDQPMDGMLERGSLPELHKTGSFGSRAEERLATLRAAQQTGPLMCSEFWDGWFDSWGEHHHVTSAEGSARELDTLLAAGASVNIYMFHGGTNFGLTNGANDKGVYRPIVTSYDYDAPLDEAGLPTAKYRAFQAVLAKYQRTPALVGAEVLASAAGLEARPTPVSPVDLGDVVASAPAHLGGSTVAERATSPTVPVRFDRTISLHDALPHLATWSMHDVVPTMDELGQATGFVMYRAETMLPDGGVLTVGEVRDRAQVIVDGVSVGVLEREHGERAIVLPPVTNRIEILVEDQGRTDYGQHIGEPKGLIGPLRVDGVELGRWSVGSLPLASIASLVEVLSAAPVSTTETIAGPSFSVASVLFDAQPEDRFLRLDGCTKGVAWVNGFCLGRYWSRGPQHTLYVPGPVLQEGRNDVVVFELHAASTRDAALVGAPDLGHTEA